MVHSALIIGCGYIGCALAVAWRKVGIRVTATTTSAERLSDLRRVADDAFIWKNGDLKSLVQNHDCLVVTVAAKGKDNYKETYLDTAKAVCEAAGLKKVIYTSSTSVYGDHHGDWVDEDTPISPLSPQAQILADTEKQYLTLPNACILRLGEIIGPGRELIERLSKQQGNELPGTGQQYTNFSHRDDIVSAIQHAYEKDLHGIYNVCQDLHVSRKDLYDTICDKMGWPRVKWNASLKSAHGGNKRVSSKKIHTTGLNFFLNSSW